MSKSVVLMMVLISFISFAWAHEGRDHDDRPPASSGADTSQRLPDGRVWMPKPAQRRLGIRTLVAEEKELAQTVELNGRVIMDPNAGGKVQASQAGRIEPGPQGLPVLGQSVKKGQVLAYVRPVGSRIERGNQQAQLAELQANKLLAEKKLARLQALEGTVPQKEIEAAQAELESLKERVQAIGASLYHSEALVAPATGVIASAQAVAGQVVEAHDVLFEVVNPERLLIEALAYDTSLANNIAEATLDINGKAATLNLLGGGQTLKDGAIPLVFRLQQRTSFAIGQPVTLFAKTKQKIKGIPLPSAAVVKNPSNEFIVWTHADAEQFMPRLVRLQPLDSQTVIVLSGLQGKERVVILGAASINQIR